MLLSRVRELTTPCHITLATPRHRRHTTPHHTTPHVSPRTTHHTLLPHPPTTPQWQDYMLMEEEFIRNQQVFKPQEEKDKEERDKMEVSRHTEVNIFFMETADPFREPSAHSINGPLA